MNDYFEISRIIAAAMAGTLTDDEQRQLSQWLAESSDNAQLYEKITDEQNRLRKRAELSEFDILSGWAGVVAKRHESRRRKMLARIGKYAAGILLPLGIAALFLFTDHGQPTEEAALVHVILPDGSRIELAGRDGAAILAADGTMVYGENTFVLPETANNSEPAYHTIEVASGGTFRLSLGDGTVVYLNSMTVLRYPVPFKEDIRRVELDGEAYFEVSPDADRPFIVHTSNYDVRVLGTEFNVTSYSGDPLSHTTLVKGSVMIEGMAALTTGQQLTYDTANGRFTVAAVDVSYSTAWKDGKLRFRDERLEDIMRTIERQYGVQVEFEDAAARELRFGFNIERHESLDPLIGLFRENGRVAIERNGENLRIRSAK
ncbi:MAG: FecR domain-containing protein [Rikenellaceae bacterium]|nr:FecR domain-containing protein [Rikenellaceae bacterium]